MGDAIDQLIAESAGIRLDIGCGAAKQAGFVGLDVRELPGVDIIHDVNIHPWPLPAECVVVAFASHLVEHIPPVAFGVDGATRFPFMEFMNEVWRIMRPTGQFAISCPHGSSQGYMQDPTHCNAINETTWAYFDPGEPRTHGLLWGIYQPKPWKIENINWSPAANIEVLLRKRGEDWANE